MLCRPYPWTFFHSKKKNKVHCLNVVILHLFKHVSKLETDTTDRNIIHIPAHHICQVCEQFYTAISKKERNFEEGTFLELLFCTIIALFLSYHRQIDRWCIEEPRISWPCMCVDVYRTSKKWILPLFERIFIWNKWFFGVLQVFSQISTWKCKEWALWLLYLIFFCECLKQMKSNKLTAWNI